MTPNEIITRAVQAIPNIRLPMAKITTERILRELEENGYHIAEGKQSRPTDGAAEIPAKR